MPPIFIFQWAVLVGKLIVIQPKTSSSNPYPFLKMYLESV